MSNDGKMTPREIARTTCMAPFWIPIVAMWEIGSGAINWFNTGRWESDGPISYEKRMQEQRKR